MKLICLNCKWEHKEVVRECPKCKNKEFKPFGKVEKIEIPSDIGYEN